MNERMQILVTVGVLALAALLLFAGGAVAGNPGFPLDVYPDAARQSNSHWSSGWVDIATDTATVFTHDLGGDPDDYAVELWFRDTTPDGKGINGWGGGGLEAGGNFYGAHWQNLTDTTIEVVRREDDAFADQVRVRVWIPEDPPVWDSQWVDIATDELKSFTHSQGGNVDDYVVGLWLKDTTSGGIGINSRCYGGLEAGGQVRGAAWQNLTNTAIDVWRYPNDPGADQVRVRIFAPDPPDWDSEWMDVAPGTVATLTHNLGGNPNLYLVRAWQKDTDGGIGINHRFAGGFEAGGSFFGTNWENLTDTTINVFRRPNDGVADQVRFRIWVREYKVLLPLVLKAYSETNFSYETSDCLESLGKADGDQVEIWVEGRDIVMEHSGAIYNCCATMVVDLIDQRPLLQLIERETYPQSGPCYCLCPYDLSARIPDLPPDTYQVEVWDESKTHLFGSAWVTVE